MCRCGLALVELRESQQERSLVCWGGSTDPGMALRRVQNRESRGALALAAGSIPSTHARGAE